MKITGARIVMKCLLEQGVRTVFGFPGAAVIDIYDELYKYRKKIKHVLVSHEQQAAHAADGYARVTGKAGVCIATSGPGATNLITGIATAYMDSSPVVFITGNVGTRLIGRDSFQEVDITSISMPVTKNNYMVKDVNKLADTIREAFLLAASGRPGPVLIDIPKDVQMEKADFVRLDSSISNIAGFTPTNANTANTANTTNTTNTDNTAYTDNTDNKANTAYTDNTAYTASTAYIANTACTDNTACTANTAYSDNTACTANTAYIANTAYTDNTAYIANTTKIDNTAETAGGVGHPFPAANLLPPSYYGRLYNGLCFDDINILTGLISGAKRPLILAGGGVIRSNASKKVTAFAELINAPVALTMMGLGAVSADDPHFIGMVGIHGTEAANAALAECDLLIAIGTRFSDRVATDMDRFAENAKIVHIDIDRAEINKNIKAEHHITGDARAAISAIITKLAPQTGKFGQKEWLERIDFLKKAQKAAVPCACSNIESNYGGNDSGDDGNSHSNCGDDDSGDDGSSRSNCGGNDSGDDGSSRSNCGGDGGTALSPMLVMKAVRELTADDAVIVTDVGQHQLWAVQYYRFLKPGTLLTSGGYGAMGFGTGAAVGACFGIEDLCSEKRPVVLITGDGSFRMNSIELATIEHYGLPVIVVVLNNHSLGMVRQSQHLLYERRFSATDLDRGPDFVKLAEAYSVDGVKAYSVADFKSVLKKKLAKKKPALIELSMSKDLLVAQTNNPGTRDGGLAENQL